RNPRPQSAYGTRNMVGHGAATFSASWPGLCRPSTSSFSAAQQRKTWIPGSADKFTRSAQGRLLWPGMTLKMGEAPWQTALWVMSGINHECGGLILGDGTPTEPLSTPHVDHELMKPPRVPTSL